VHPLAPGAKTPPGNCEVCRSPGHTPTGCRCLGEGRWCHGHLAATTDADLITDWWSANPRFGVGIACGPAGLTVIDVDAHTTPVPDREHLLPGIVIGAHVDLSGLADGFSTLALLAALRGAPDPAEDRGTLRVRTPSGGMHIWYASGPHLPFRSSTGSGRTRALAWQVDVRAGGGYIVAPGTTIPAGVYTALGTARRPAPLPDWLAGELMRTNHLHAPVPGQYAAPGVPPRAHQAVVSAGGGLSAASRVVEGALAEVAGCAAVPEGAGFTEKLNRAAYTAGGLVAGGYLSEQEAERLLLDTALRARPRQEQRCTTIIRSGLAAGARRPLHLQGRP